MGRYRKSFDHKSKSESSLLKEDGDIDINITTPYTKRSGVIVKKEEVEEAIKKCRGLLYLASNVLGINHQQLEKYINDDPDLAQIYKEERGKTLDRAEAKLMQAVDTGEQWAITLILRTLGRERGYVERQELASVSHVKLEIVEEIVDRDSKDIKVSVDYTPRLPETFIEERNDDA